MKKTAKNYIDIRKKSPKKIITNDILNDIIEKKFQKLQKTKILIIKILLSLIDFLFLKKKKQKAKK